jgi:hypothetical protein
MNEGGRTMPENYEIFEKWVQMLKPKMDSGEKVKVPVKSLETLGKIVVIAKLGSSQDSLPGGIPVRIVNDMGEKRGELFMEIIEELSEGEVGLSVGI